jgi:hypothetical protein
MNQALPITKMPPGGTASGEARKGGVGCLPFLLEKACYATKATIS